MKKEFIALIILSALIIGSIANVLYLDRLVTNMDSHIKAAIDAYTVKNIESAEYELSCALGEWLNNEAYTHVFIRHAEIDTTTDAYYEALSAIHEKSDSTIALLSKTRYHIKSILSMEQVTLKSVM